MERSPRVARLKRGPPQLLSMERGDVDEHSTCFGSFGFLYRCGTLYRALESQDVVEEEYACRDAGQDSNDRRQDSIGAARCSTALATLLWQQVVAVRCGTTLSHHVVAIPVVAASLFSRAFVFPTGTWDRGLFWSGPFFCAKAQKSGPSWTARAKEKVRFVFCARR